MINFELLISSFPALIAGAVITMKIALFSCCIGLLLGTFLGFGLAHKNRLLRSIVHIYTGIFRGTPMLIQILFTTFALPTVGIQMSTFAAVVWAIGLNSAAYIAHSIRSGIESISRGQIEAAQTLGLSRWQITRFIILPQAIRIVLPSLGNEFITLIKDSSLASYVGVMELTKEGEILSSRTFDALTIYTGVAIVYLCITGILTLLVNHIEKKLDYHAQH